MKRSQQLANRTDGRATMPHRFNLLYSLLVFAFTMVVLAAVFDTSLAILIICKLLFAHAQLSINISKAFSLIIIFLLTHKIIMRLLLSTNASQQSGAHF